MTDAGLGHLQGLRRLEKLYLYGTRITDAGLGHLQGMDQLQKLYLAGTEVTDAGLATLVGLSRLSVLDLEDALERDLLVARFKEQLTREQIASHFVAHQADYAGARADASIQAS